MGARQSKGLDKGLDPGGRRCDMEDLYSTIAAMELPQRNPTTEEVADGGYINRPPFMEPDRPIPSSRSWIQPVGGLNEVRFKKTVLQDTEDDTSRVYGSYRRSSLSDAESFVHTQPGHKQLDDPYLWSRSNSQSEAEGSVSEFGEVSELPAPRDRARLAHSAPSCGLSDSTYIGVSETEQPYYYNAEMAQATTSDGKHGFQGSHHMVLRDNSSSTVSEMTTRPDKCGRVMTAMAADTPGAESFGYHHGYTCRNQRHDLETRAEKFAVTAQGGLLRSSSRGISGIIPEGAVRQNEAVEIVIAQTQDPYLCPNIEPGEEASSVFQFLPHGATFEKKLTIQLHHGEEEAAGGYGLTRIRVMYSPTGEDETPKWRPIYDNRMDGYDSREEDGRSMISATVTNMTTILKLLRFCAFCVLRQKIAAKTYYVQTYLRIADEPGSRSIVLTALFMSRTMKEERADVDLKERLNLGTLVDEQPILIAEDPTSCVRLGVHLAPGRWKPAKSTRNIEPINAGFILEGTLIYRRMLVLWEDDTSRSSSHFVADMNLGHCDVETSIKVIQDIHWDSEGPSKSHPSCLNSTSTGVQCGAPGVPDSGSDSGSDTDREGGKPGRDGHCLNSTSKTQVSSMNHQDSSDLSDSDAEGCGERAKQDKGNRKSRDCKSKWRSQKSFNRYTRRKRALVPYHEHDSPCIGNERPVGYGGAHIQNVNTTFQVITHHYNGSGDQFKSLKALGLDTPKIPYLLKVDIAKGMNVERCDGRDWRALAAAYRIPRTQLHKSENPTMRILDELEGRVDFTKESLISTLRGAEVDRKDLADMVEEHWPRE